MKIKRVFLLSAVGLLSVSLGSCSKLESISVDGESILYLEKPYFSFTSESANWNITEDTANLDNCSYFIFTENNVIYGENIILDYEQLPDGTYQKTECDMEYSTIEYNTYEYNKNGNKGLRIEFCKNPFFDGEFYIEKPGGVITYSLFSDRYYKVNTGIDVSNILNMNISQNYTF